jgi:major membrane immunogen (membrane-anchored lipoprotein)
MRKLAIGIVVVVAISMMFVQVSFAQKSQAAGSAVSTGAWSLGLPALDADKGFTGNEAIVVESGKVMKVEKMAGVKDGQQMKFKTDQGNAYTVYMGPKWFIENQKLKFAAGDSVMVRGKKFGSSIIAAEISKGDWTMKLRNEEDGQPSWECCYPGTVKMQ